MRSAPVPLALAVLAVALAGCSDAPAADELAEGGEHAGHGMGHGMHSIYDSGAPGGAPYTREYSGRAMHDGPNEIQGPPGAPATGPVQTCCLYSWVDAADLLQEGQLVTLRATLTWTNTQQDNANLDIALCIPWFCGFPPMPDQTNQAGTFTETFDLISGGRAEFLEFMPAYQVGVRYSNLVTAAGIPFTLRVDAVPVEDALAFVDPYEVVVPPNATLIAELVGPTRGDGISAGLLVYGEDDRPLAYRELTGGNGSLHELGLEAGSYVIAPFQYDGGFVRLHLNGTDEPRPARRLQEAFGVVEVAAIADPAPHEGTFRFDSPPGSMDTFPFFEVDPAAVQFPGVSASSHIVLSSSSGVVADMDFATFGAVVPNFGQTCLTCVGNGEWNPENYVDDDGGYDVTYDSTYAVGKFMLFTATYSR